MLTLGRDVPEKEKPQQPQQQDLEEGRAYLKVVFLSTPSEDSDRILGVVEASMDSSLTPAQKADVIEVLKDFQKTWLAPPEGGGACTAGMAQLEVFGRPIRAKLRPLSDPLRRVLGRHHLFSCPLPHLWDMVQKALSEGSRAATAFITPFGLYEWRVLPFGLKNSPAEFQRIMDFVLCVEASSGVRALTALRPGGA
eukprot:GHVS01019652.1.p1 GENE.GHVS01019652.1~~GHVS01019652.1.p1  ORF type:complete len:196 (-),score=27.15 GHVS01019652.1:146-733(-)